MILKPTTVFAYFPPEKFINRKTGFYHKCFEVLKVINNTLTNIIKWNLILYGSHQTFRLMKVNKADCRYICVYLLILPCIGNFVFYYHPQNYTLVIHFLMCLQIHDGVAFGGEILHAFHNIFLHFTSTMAQYSRLDFFICLLHFTALQV